MASYSTYNINNSVIGALNHGGTIKSRSIRINTEQTYNFDMPPLIKTFSGRDKELNQLASLVFNANKEKIKSKIVICGFGGIGKSELAKQFAKKCQDAGKIQKTYWINSESESELKQSSKRIKEIYTEMKGKMCLFILDNGINRKMLSECEFELSNDFFFIITSTEKDWGDDIQSFRLNSFELMLAVRFYKEYFKRDYYNYEEQKLFIKLAKFVGCIPLGLQITAAHLQKAQKIHGEKYLQLYVKDLEESQNEIIEIDFPASTDNSYKKSIYQAILLSLNKVAINNELKYRDIALCAVYICSYLDPERINFYDLLAALNAVGDFFNSKKLNEYVLEKVLYILDNLSLVSYYRNKATIKMHRFIQEVLRYHLKINDPLMQERCYSACLKTCLKLRDYQLDSILQYADENHKIFNAFYNKRKRNLNKYWYEFCVSLIRHKCTKSLEIILDNQSAESYIFKINLNYFPLRKLNDLKLILDYFKINSKACKGMYNKLLLYTAAPSCNLYAIRFLLEHGADINIKNKQGNNPLFELFKRVHYNEHLSLYEILYIEEVLSLLKFQESVDFKNKSGESYLHVVRNPYLAKHLITKYKMNVNVIDLKQQIPLHKVISELVYGKLIKELILHGALLNAKDSIGMTPLALAQHKEMETNLIRLFSEDQYIVVLRKIFKEFDKDNVKQIIDESYILHRAMQYHQTELLKFLLEYNININIRNFLQVTPLHTAMWYWNLNALKILVENNADPNFRCNFDLTPLQHFFLGALYREHIDMDEVNMILELLQYDCDINKNAVAKCKHTLLHVAAFSCHADLVDLIVTKYKTNVNLQNTEGDTPLHFLISSLPYGRYSRKEYDIIETVRTLEAYGARLDIKNKYELTPFEFAKQQNAEFLLPYLVEFEFPQENYLMFKLYYLLYILMFLFFVHY